MKQPIFYDKLFWQTVLTNLFFLIVYAANQCCRCLFWHLAAVLSLSFNCLCLMTMWKLTRQLLHPLKQQLFLMMESPMINLVAPAVSHLSNTYLAKLNLNCNPFFFVLFIKKCYPSINNFNRWHYLKPINSLHYLWLHLPKKSCIVDKRSKIYKKKTI